jgi:hypothetical protein
MLAFLEKIPYKLLSNELPFEDMSGVGTQN